MITYTTTASDVTPEALEGFFVGWERKLTPESHLRVLQGSDYVVLAKDGEKVVGYITAITDKVISAYVPLLEVLPEYQKQGIGGELVRRMLVLLKEFYMIDLLCSENLQPFYGKFGMEQSPGMCMRNEDVLDKLI